MDAIALKPVTYKDFPIEDHVRAYLEINPHCYLRVQNICGNTYRGTVTDPESRKITSCIIIIEEGEDRYNITLQGEMS